MKNSELEAMAEALKGVREVIVEGGAVKVYGDARALKGVEGVLSGFRLRRRRLLFHDLHGVYSRLAGCWEAACGRSARHSPHTELPS